MKVTTALPAIEALLDKWQATVRSMNARAILEFYSDDVIAYDAIMELQFKGKPAYLAHYEKCFAMCPPGEMIWEMRDLHIEAGANLAFCHAVLKCGMQETGGDFHGGWMRWTGCLRNEPQGWIFVHEHFSAPFDPATTKVVENLQP